MRTIARPAPLLLAALLAAGCASSTPTASPSGGAAASGAASLAPTAVAATATPAPVSVCAAVIDPAAHDWDGRVWYELFVRSFADGNGDGIGDLRGLTARLDYLNDGDPATTTDLGVTGLWLMPIAESPSYHGYDVVDYEHVDRDYGSNAGFRAFLAAAHSRGIKVVVDLVLNHTSIDHPWFQASRRPGSPKADWYLWSDTDPGYAGPSGQPVWHPLDGRWYYGQFSSGMPDLNLANPEVTDALVGVARFWLQDMGVDGFRLDAIKHLVEEGETQVNTASTLAWLAGFKTRVEAIKPDALLVGEVYDLTLASSRYVPDAVDMTFDFELASNMLQAVRNGDASSLSIVQGDVLDRYAGRGYASFLTNHDQPRTMSELRDDPASARVAASELLTGPGVPFVYYGEELGMTGDKPDERIRAPMPWTGEGPGLGFTTGTPWEEPEPGYETANVALESGDSASLLEHYRRLVALRAAHPALRSGTWIPLRSKDPGVYAFLAADRDETVAVVLNVGDTAVTGTSLTLDGATGCTRAAPAVAYADGYATTPAVTAPAFGADGMLEGWTPVTELPARSTLVVTLH